MGNYEPPPEKTEPWWNDGSKVGGMASTMILLSLAVFVACCIIAAGIGIVKLVS